MKNGTTKQIYGADIPPKETTATAKKKAKLPSGDAGKSILWPENNGKKIKNIWTGRKYSSTRAKYSNKLH